MSGSGQAVSFGAGSAQPQGTAAGQDQASDSAQQQAGNQPDQQPTQPVAKPEGAAPEYLTREEANTLFDTLKQEVQRMAQSQADKAISGAQKRFEKQISAIEQRLGKAFDPNTREAVAQVLAGGEGAQQTGTGQAAQPSGQSAPQVDPKELDYVNRRTSEIFEEFGVEIQEGDPEAASLDFSTTAQFIKTLRTAAATKATRTKVGQQQTNTNQTAARLPAIGSGGGRANPILDNFSPADLIREALDQMD